jgi:TolB-like protein
MVMVKKITYILFILIISGCATNQKQNIETSYNFNNREINLIVNKYKNNEQFKNEYRRVFEEEPPQSIEDKIYQGMNNELRKINVRNNSNANNNLYIDIDSIEMSTIDIPGKDIKKFTINISLKYVDIYNNILSEIKVSGDGSFLTPEKAFNNALNNTINGIDWNQIIVNNDNMEKIILKGNIAIIELETKDEQILKNNICETITNIIENRIFQKNNLTLIDRNKIETVIKEHDYQMSGYVSDDEVKGIGQFLGADYLLTGSVSFVDGNYYINVRIIEVNSLKIVFSNHVIAKDLTEFELSISKLFSIIE